MPLILSSILKLQSYADEPSSFWYLWLLFFDQFAFNYNLLPTCRHLSYVLPKPYLGSCHHQKLPLAKIWKLDMLPLFILSVSPKETLTVDEPVLSLPAWRS